MQRNTQPGLSLSLQFMLAAVLALLLIAINVGLFHRVLEHLHGVGDTINAVGRMRMLSQKIGYATMWLGEDGQGAEKIVPMLDEMKGALQVLERGGDLSGFSVRALAATQRSRFAIIRADAGELDRDVRAALASAPDGRERTRLRRIADESERLRSGIDALIGALIAEARRDEEEALTTLYALLGLNLALLAAAFLIVRRRIVQPLRHLAELSRAYAAGRFQERAYADSGDEIGQLARAFNAMAEKTQQHIGELRRLSRAVEQSPAAVMISDCALPDNPLIYVNPACERITGYAAAEVLGRNARFLYGAEAEQPGLSDIRTALREKREAHAVVRNFRRDGSPFWADFHISPVQGDDGRLTHYISIVSDVTERVLYEGQLSHQAQHDALTGLANRHLLDDRLDQAIAQGHRHSRVVAVVFIDIDHFKHINDSLGHAVGDQVVKEVGSRLKKCVREGDTVARMGGDEFVLILSDCEQDAYLNSALQRMLEMVKKPIGVAEHELHITCSIGASLYPRDGEDRETLLKHADAAMYRAKEEGRGCFRFYTRDINERLAQRTSMEKMLREALEKNQFVLHFQPQVDLVSGTIVGGEALVRWNHPDYGLLEPGRFIPLAEETGLIVQLGAWVLDAACAQNRIWQAQGLPLITVAVNLSARQFRQKNIHRLVEQSLRHNGLRPQFLDLEITETMVMHDHDEAMEQMRELKTVGCKLSMDDFGTGHSSLARLKDLPLDALKLDRAFVRNIASDERDSAIAATVVRLARSLAIGVIAEGVETAAQLDRLKGLGCDRVQGYYFSRPVPAKDFTALLTMGQDFARAEAAIA